MALYGLNTFDENYYLANNPDVVTAIAQGVFQSAEQHYQLFGEAELRMPNAAFDPQYYFSTYPDVLSAVEQGLIPGALWHFENYGLAEGRRPSEQVDFNEANYLAQNPDVAAAVANGDFSSGWEHFVQYGQAEGREPGGTTPPIGETIQLTIFPDNIQLDGTQIDTVQGLVQPFFGTFSPGDIIDGNGNTILRLVVADSGDAAFATVNDIANVNLVAGTGSWVDFNAVDWHNIGAVNLTSGADGLNAWFDNFYAGDTDWTIAGVGGSLSASFTNDTYFYMSVDHNGAISWIDGIVNGSAGAGEDVYFSYEVWGNNIDTLFGDVTLVGANADSGSFDVSNFADMGGDITVGNVSITGFLDDAWVGIYNYGHTENSAPVNTTVGDITISTGKSGALWISVTQSGYNQVGDVTVGAITATIPVNAYGSFEFYNTAYYDDVGDDVTVGNMVVGDMAVSVGQSGDFFAEFDQFADAWTGGRNATVGDMQIGALNLTLGQNAWATVTVSDSAWAGTATGSATVGNIAIGAINLDMATDSSFEYTFSASAYASAGEASIGNLTFGDVEISQGVNSWASLSYSIYAYGAAGSVIGDITFGDLMVDANDGASFEFSFEATSYGDIGAVAFGDMSLSGGVSADISVYNSISASNDIGPVTFGNITQVAGKNADVWNYISLSAWDGQIGDVTVGDISLAAGQAGSAWFSFEASGETAIGDVTFGDIGIVANGLNAFAGASITIENDGGGSLGDMTVGTVSMDVNGENASGYFYASASSASTGGVMTFGGFDLSVTSGAKKLGAEVYVSLYNSLSDVVMGGISLSGGVRGATDTTMTYSADVNAYAAGNLNVGDITVSGGDGASDNFATLDFAVPGWLDVSAGGNVVVGAIDYSGYGAAATIDVSTVGGAPSIAGTAKNDLIIDNKGANALTGNGGADTFTFIDTNTGKTLATLDQILDFTNGAGDKIDITPVVNVGNYSEGVYADFATYAAAANAGNKAVFVGEVGGVDGVIAAVDYDVNGSVDFMINLVGVGLDGVDVASFV
jgi:hypothetical protein